MIDCNLREYKVYTVVNGLAITLLAMFYPSHLPRRSKRGGVNGVTSHAGWGGKTHPIDIPTIDIPTAKLSLIFWGFAGIFMAMRRSARLSSIGLSESQDSVSLFVHSFQFCCGNSCLVCEKLIETLVNFIQERKVRKKINKFFWQLLFWIAFCDLLIYILYISLYF